MSEQERCETIGRPFLLGYNAETKEGVAFRPNCGLWTCEYCAQEKAKMWMLHAFHGTTILQSQGYQMDFITLTARGGKGRTRAASLEAFATGFPLLTRRAKYYMGYFEYLAIPEQHKNGIVHYHLIATNTLAQRFWKDNAYEVGLGFMSHVKRIKQAGYAAKYVSKYVGKEFTTAKWPKNYRRVRASRNWPKASLPEIETGWTYEVYRDLGTLNWYMAMLRDAGYTITEKPSLKPR